MFQIILLVILGVIVVGGVAFLLMRAFVSPMIVIRSSVVRNVASFLGSAVHDANAIYDPDARKDKRDVVIPFPKVVSDRLEAMTIVHFAENEAKKYLGFEPQLYRVPGGERLERCLAFTEKRTDADAYVPADKTALNDMTYRVNRPVDDVRDTIEMQFDRFGLSVKDTGLRVDLAFTDRYDRKIELNIDEQQLGKAAVFKSAIAPASLATHADYFPLIFLTQMSIANRRSQVSAKVDGVEMGLLKIPVLGTNLIIYGRDAVGYYLFLTTPDTPAQVHRSDGQRSSIEVRGPNCQEGREQIIAPDDEITAVYQLEDNAGYAEISRAAYRTDDKEMKMEFQPPIPALLYVRDGAAVSGRFAVSTESTPGMMIGSYEVHRKGQDVTFSLQPEKAYQPVEGDQWVRAYRHISVVHIGGDEPHIETHWEKKKIINEGMHVTVVD